jgi:hypothetical protein
MTYAYRWQRCDTTGAGCLAITGATSPSYTVASTEAGSTLRVQVTATNSAGSGSATSQQTAVVTASTPPTNTSSPAISGTPAQGQALTASTGIWSGTTPMSYGYQWQRCDTTGAGCAAITSATGSSYTLGAADAGSTLRVQVTATNSVGSAGATSPQTGAVTNLLTLTFTGTLTKNTISLAFPLTIGAGEADATLSFSKTAAMIVQLVTATGAVAGQVSGTRSPLTLNVPDLAAGSYKYVVSGSGYKGSVSFTLTVIVPGA